MVSSVEAVETCACRLRDILHRLGASLEASGVSEGVLCAGGDRMSAHSDAGEYFESYLGLIMVIHRRNVKIAIILERLSSCFVTNMSNRAMPIFKEVGLASALLQSLQFGSGSANSQGFQFGLSSSHPQGC